jgi:hypothetical protein
MKDLCKQEAGQGRGESKKSTHCVHSQHSCLVALLLLLLLLLPPLEWKGATQRLRPDHPTAAADMLTAAASPRTGAAASIGWSGPACQHLVTAAAAVWVGLLQQCLRWACCCWQWPNGTCKQLLQQLPVGSAAAAAAATVSACGQFPYLSGMHSSLSVVLSQAQSSTAEQLPHAAQKNTSKEEEFHKAQVSDVSVQYEPGSSRTAYTQILSACCCGLAMADWGHFLHLTSLCLHPNQLGVYHVLSYRASCTCVTLASDACGQGAQDGKTGQ